MSARPGGGAREEWRRHWPVPVAGCVAIAASTVNAYSTALFIDPLQHAFGWSRAQIMAGPALAAVASVLLGPFAGFAIDRIGPRRIGIFGIVALCTLTALLGATGPGVGSWFAVWVLLALINSCIQPTVWTAAASSLFAAGRGAALAVMLCGSGVGSIVMPLLAFELIERLGWRLAFPAMAGCVGAVAIPIILLFFTSARDRERTRGDCAPRRIRSDRAVLRQMLSARFLKLLIAAFLIAAVIVPIVINIVPILTSTGLGRGEAASVAAVLGVSSIVGRLTIGLLLDRLDGRLLAAVSVILPVLSIALLRLNPGSLPAAAAAVMILGVALGAEYDIVAYLTSRYFDIRHFGLFFGTIAGAVTLAGGGGPAVVSAVFDRSGSYWPALIAAMPACGVCALLFLMLGRPPPLRSPAEGAVAPEPQSEPFTPPGRRA